MHMAKINNERFGIWGSGRQESLYVDDLSMSILHIIENQIEDDLINIGSGEEISIYDLSLKIKNILDFHGEIVFDTSIPDGNPENMVQNKFIWLETSNS